jgi:sulfatase modifying factor 1
MTAAVRPDRARPSADNWAFALVRRKYAGGRLLMVRHAVAALIAALVVPVMFSAASEDAAEARSPQPAPLSPFAPLASSPPDLGEGSSQVEARPALAAACPKDMVLVEGDYCTEAAQVCAHWLDDPTLPFARCGEYAKPAVCVGDKVRLRYCIDRYEYTAPGERLPLNYASFKIAGETCAALGKRVCTESEWTFACEGEEMRPYPYGWSREPKCNQDRDDLYEPNPHMQVLADRRLAADANPECISPFGVYDMVGNMDEPVLREGPEHISPHRNALKGGWWMPARNRCRPATTAHDDYYKDIQVGVRCCGAATG